MAIDSVERCASPTEAMSVRALVAAASHHYGDLPALYGHNSDNALTYRQLGANVDSLIEALQALNVTPAHRVATFLPAGPTAVTVMTALMSLAIYAPLNPRARYAECVASLRALRADCIVVEKGQQCPGRTAAQAIGLPIIEVLAPADGSLGGVELHAVDPLGPTETDSNTERLAYILQTSGTTSMPKIVPLTQPAFLRTMRHNIASLKITPRDRCLHLIAPAHVMGITTVIYSFMAGSQVVCCPGLDPTRFFDWFDRFQPTWLTAPPALHHSIIAAGSEHAQRVAKNPPRFIRAGAATMPPTLLASIEKFWHAPLIEAYGMSECPLITTNALGDKNRKPGSVGRQIDGVEVKILADASVAGGHEVGEILLRGPQVFAGYDNAPEENRDSFSDGWFHTGDLGCFDADGFLFLKGRCKELINRGGIKVAPQEIDQVVQRHPAVADALTFAIPDPRLGETIGVAIVLRAGQTVSENAIRGFVAGELNAEKVPQHVAFLDALPTGITGKAQRIGLAARLGLDQTPSPIAKPLVAPADAIEDALAAIWQHVLRSTGPVSVESHFVADLGGDSLQAVAMLAEASRIFGRDIPVATLLTAPTIRALAAACRGNRGKAPSHRVPIQIPGNLPPLFCFPGMHGNAYSFYPLARALGDSQPMYAFTLPGVYADDELLAESIPDLARNFLQLIHEVQPTGPYHLAGYSFGGYLAFEMAQQLLEAGQAVARLIMFDTRGPGFPKRRGLLGRAAYHLRRKFRGDKSDRRPKAREQLDSPQSRNSQSTTETVAGRSLKLIREYQPRHFSGTITLLRAAEHPEWFEACVPDRTMGWGRWADDVTVLTTPGTHVTILERSQVPNVATLLGRAR